MSNFKQLVEHRSLNIKTSQSLLNTVTQWLEKRVE